MDFWNLFENWSLRDYLKIGFLGIKCKNENFRKLNLKEIRIENYLRSRNYENWIIKIGNLGNHSKAEFLEINE